MRTLLSGIVFLVVFSVVLLPFVLFRMAVDRGDLEPLAPVATGIFAALSGLIGWALASLSATYVRESRNPPSINVLRFRLGRTLAIQLLFVGIGLALASISMQHYPIYRDIVGRSLAYDLKDLFESGWLVFVGGIVALLSAYKLVSGSKDDTNA